MGPKLRNALFQREAPPSVAWRREVDRWRGDRVYVTGRYRHRRGTDTLVVVVHGLGGCADSDYAVDAARRVDRAGHACLRLELRGANRSGDDLYHGGLWEDVAAAVTAPKFQDFDRILVVGFSLGGHVALRTAIELDSPRLAGVAAVCSPLDLGAAQREIDSPAARPYRQYLLRELRQGYQAVVEHKPGPTPLERVEMIRTLREWDALTVVPRFDFDDVDDYYRRASVAGQLDDLRVPALLVAARNDPLVYSSAIEAGLPVHSEQFDLHWAERGGHVFLPKKLDLGYGDSASTPQICSTNRSISPVASGLDRWMRSARFRASSRLSSMFL
ncbi:MAG: alpha/beta fold hydrolase [Bradymonadaceae bacterium]